MKTAIEKAILALVEKTNHCTKADDALKFTQAALNLAHAALTFNSIKDESLQGR